VGAKQSHFLPHFGPSAACAGLENRPDTVSWDEKGLRNPDQRISISHVGLDHERSNIEKMRSFGALWPQKCSFDARGRLNACEVSEKLIQVFG